jgi:arylsulfatase A-like enzyme
MAALGAPETGRPPFSLRYTERMARSPRRPPARPRRALAAAASAGLLLLTPGCGGPTPESERSQPPNLLLITVDTLRPDHLRCYGGEPDVGDFLCSLADAGIRFEWAFSTAPYTAPSVASILTGLYPSFHGVSQTAVSYLRDEFETLPELLQGAGYETAAFVSNPMLERSHQLDQGFEVYDQKMPIEERNRPGRMEREAQSTTDAALAWAQTSARPPWFVWVHFQDPHGPYEPPDGVTGHDEEGGTRLPVLENDHSGLGGIPSYQALPGLVTREAYERRYTDEIRYLDGHVKRLVEGLDALGDPPAVLLTADHGEALGEDGYYFAHGHSVGLDQIRVPLLWRPAAPETPAVARTAVSLLDVAPTLLRVAGLEAPENWPGRPLPLTKSQVSEEPGERVIFAEHGRRAAVIVGDAYFARDRREVVEGERDPNSGGRVKMLPPRTAHLDGSGAMPAYEPAEGSAAAAALEPTLARFLADAERNRSAAEHEAAPEDVRERLRALGYVK